MIIYISSPYTIGDVCENVRAACMAGDEILGKGHTPFIPHLTHLWHIISPKPYNIWLELDMNLMSMCDAVLRLPGESRGADLEIKQAREWCMPVYFKLEDIPCPHSRI